MAGIGFVLQKLSNQDNLSGKFQAYLYSALISTGPWIFTILSLIGIVKLAEYFDLYANISIFRIIIIYNFSFSLVFSGPIFIIVTRYLADQIYAKDVSNIPGMMFGATILLFLIELPIVGLFYLLYIQIPTSMALNAIINFLLVSELWLILVFITALKDFKSVIQGFMFGTIIMFTSFVIFPNDISNFISNKRHCIINETCCN